MFDVDKTYSLIGKKLKEARKEQQLTQAELADGIVTRNMLSRIEHGMALPSLPVLCAFASRLNMPVGYFIDDYDDGTSSQNRRLLDMIWEEYKAEHYDSCLHFCQCLTDFEDERDQLMASCRFRLAEEAMHQGRLREAQQLFSQLIKEDCLPTVVMEELCVLYRALLSCFLSEPETGKEESFLLSLRQFATFPHDLITLSGILALLKDNFLAEAKAMFSVSVFRENAYAKLCEARIAIAEQDFVVARKRLLETMGFQILPPIACYCLTLLERCAAELKDYESAYAYLVERRDRVLELTKKV